MMASNRTFERDLEGSPLARAYALGRIARAAYSSAPAEEHPDLPGAFECVQTFRSQRIYGLVAGNGEHVVVAFRGTHEDREWVEALAYGQAPWVAGRAHKGFTRLLDTVWTQVLAGLYDAQAFERRLWLTGHSIGGALALLAAQRLEFEGFSPEAVFSFGSPAVLDPTAARAFRCSVYRVVNNEDAVPDVPWPTLVDTYVHAGETIFLTASGERASNRYTPHLARRIDRAMSIGQGVLPAGPLHDHSIEAYLTKLRRYAAG